MKAQTLVGMLGLLLALLSATGEATAQDKSEEAVKATLKADKIGADGKQLVTITLEIDPRYHIYANPVGNEDFDSNKTSVGITSKNKLESVKVDYPAGDLVKDSVVGDYKVYKGKVTFKAAVQRAKGDTGPLSLTIALQACSDKEKKCLLPSKMKLTVP